ncbi:PEP-CTERM sorting domain-containing protein [Bryobacter aggregatus]|uniref:PEP-CTERM sorting domain-containing protein n=1 Tax=Bryobacter aggregatus TaxID=360054 RepID=UPI0004E17D88|nr:PEP-CTERM sorting domain-containing protein [Bryobacter aggregatus]
MRATLITSLLFCSAAYGGTLQITGVDTSRGGSVYFLENGELTLGYAGVIQGIYNGNSIDTLFCVDLFTPINFDDYESRLVYPHSERSEDRVAWLLNTRLTDINSPNYGIALQLAIWDIIHDGGDGLATGSIQASFSGSPANQTPTEIITLVNLFLAESLGMSSTNATIFINTLTSNNTPAQNLIGSFRPETTSDVPEPASIGFAAFGLIALCLARKRKDPNC